MMLSRPMHLKVDLWSGWRITDEKLHGAVSLPGGDGRQVYLGASDVALFCLAHSRRFRFTTSRGLWPLCLLLNGL